MLVFEHPNYGVTISNYRIINATFIHNNDFFQQNKFAKLNDWTRNICTDLMVLGVIRTILKSQNKVKKQ